MDVKQAVRLAKSAVQDLFGDQTYSDPLLEEVEYDETGPAWMITVGFLRMPEISKLDRERSPSESGLGPFGIPRRAYKVVRINDGTGQVVSVKDREFA